MSPLKSTFGAASAFGWLPRGASKTNITGAESTLWSGGSSSGPGASVSKYTNQTIAIDTTYTVTIGAASSNSAIAGGVLGRTATVSSSSASNNVNGTVATYSTFGGSTQFGPGNYGQWYYYQSVMNYGGSPGAGGNGAPQSNDVYGSGSWRSGDGGLPFTAVTSLGLSGFPATGVGCGGSGNYTPYSPAFNNWYGYSAYLYGSSGNCSPSGANTGNGYGGNNQYAAGSGGFTLRYADTFAQLGATTGDVVYLNSGGYHNYFWKTTGTFTI